VRILAAGVLASTAAAQSSCRFVLGFAALRTTIRAQRAGTCLEDEWTTTSAVAFHLGAKTLTVPSGSVVQRTTRGIFVWLPAVNATQFLTEDGYWVQGEPAATYSRWSATEAEQQAPPTPAPARSAARVDVPQARSASDSLG
jgi:hypothetical protein